MPTKPTDDELWTAAQTGDIETMRTLLAAGADPNAAKEGTPLLIALALGGKVERIDVLLDAGADLMRTNPEGLTVMTALAWLGSTPEQGRVFDRLIERGADVNEAAKNGMSLIEVASSAGNEMMFEKLQAAGVVASHELREQYRRMRSYRRADDLPAH